jgi:hypothetical protein
MPILFDPARHQSVSVTWEPHQVEQWLQRWSQAALAHWQAQQAFPCHPRDQEDGIASLYTLYMGAAGVWVALARLAQAGYLALPEPLAAIYQRIDQGYQQAPDTGSQVPSWFLGRSGILTAQWLAAPGDEIADTLATLISANATNPTREFLWGAPGTMIAALFLWEHSQDVRWANLFRASAERLWESWYWDPAQGHWLWEQDMYGTHCQYVGAGHGWVGNLYPLWRGYSLLTLEQQACLSERTLMTLSQLQICDGEQANWPALFGQPDRLLVQWCHGAPGMITALKYAPLPELTPLLTAGGRLILAAGPLVKGVGLCHGTDGNAFALLELYHRTQEPIWLTQAQSLAMAALHQSQQAYQTYGDWRYSLWTGDAGLACLLLACLGHSLDLPGLDSF